MESAAGSPLVRLIVDAARRACGPARPVILFVGGEEDAVLRALPRLARELPLRPALVGRAEAIAARAAEVGCELGETVVLDPRRSPDLPFYAARLLEMRRRRGLTPAAAERQVLDPLTFALLSAYLGRVDGVVAGPTWSPAAALREILGLVGAGAAGRACGVTLLRLGERLLLLADTALAVQPSPAELAEAALTAAGTAPLLGIDPRLAFLSLSDFGSLHHPAAAAVRKAAELAKARRPDLPLDGEMQPLTALDPRRAVVDHPHSRIRGEATVLLFPDLQSAVLATQFLQLAQGAEMAGPFLAGLERPVNLLSPRPSEEQILCAAAVTATQAVAGARPPA